MDGGCAAALTCLMTSNLKALDGCPSHHLQGPGHSVAAPLQLISCVIGALQVHDDDEREFYIDETVLYIYLYSP